MFGVPYASTAMQAEPQSHASDPDTDEESAAFIRRWLDLAKAVLHRDKPDEDTAETPAK